MMPKPLKESELRKFATCIACHQKIGQTGTPILHIVTVETHILDMAAINRQHGLGMMLGGNGMLASVMGPDEGMTRTVREQVKMMICHDCAHNPLMIGQLIEEAAEFYKSDER